MGVHLTTYCCNYADLNSDSQHVDNTIDFIDFHNFDLQHAFPLFGRDRPYFIDPQAAVHVRIGSFSRKKDEMVAEDTGIHVHLSDGRSLWVTEHAADTR